MFTLENEIHSRQLKNEDSPLDGVSSALPLIPVLYRKKKARFLDQKAALNIGKPIEKNSNRFIPELSL